MDYQWYPGHMTKARRQMQEDIKLIDLVIEILDARAPWASRNPDIDNLAQGKARLVLLNKSDLADDQVTKRWIAYFNSKGIEAVALDSRARGSAKKVEDKIEKACAAKRERDARKGLKNRPIRAMVCGIPNAGKSTFINSFSGKAAAKTGNKPGVTKGKQWIRLSGSVELLDTPGILWPKFEDQKVGEHLAMIGSIKDEVLNIDELALALIAWLLEKKPGCLNARYDVEESAAPLQVMEDIAKRRACFRQQNEIDYTKCAKLILDELRSGKLGRITLEEPSDED